MKVKYKFKGTVKKGPNESREVLLRGTKCYWIDSDGIRYRKKDGRPASKVRYGDVELVLESITLRIDIKNGIARRMNKAVQDLNLILNEVRKEHPNAQWYLDGTWNLHLMKGPPHDDNNGCCPLQENTLHSAELINSGGGDW